MVNPLVTACWIIRKIWAWWEIFALNHFDQHDCKNICEPVISEDVREPIIQNRLFQNMLPIVTCCKKPRICMKKIKSLHESFEDKRLWNGRLFILLLSIIFLPIFMGCGLWCSWGVWIGKELREIMPCEYNTLNPGPQTWRCYRIWIKGLCRCD